MSDRTTISVRADRELSEALDEAADEIDTSKSQLVRDLLREQLLDRDGSEWDLPEYLVVEARREQIKRENKVNDLRGGFEGRVRSALSKRFKNGYDPDDVRAVATGFIREARLLFDDDVAEAKVEWIEERIDDYVDARDSSTFDPDGEFLASFGGVEDGEIEEQLDEERIEMLADVARDLDEDGRSQQLIGATLSDRYDADPREKRAALRRAGVVKPTEASADD